MWKEHNVKITDIETYMVSCTIPEEHRVQSGAGRKVARQAAFVVVHTDEGLSGIGPCSFGSISWALNSVTSLVDDAFKPALLGEDPFDTEWLWDKLFHGLITRSLGHRGVGVAILSALDIAFWDLKGKALGEPLYRLLGGAYRRPVPLYASSIYWGKPEEAAEEAIRYRDEGYPAVKLKIGHDTRSGLACVEAVRRALGDEMEIMVDANLCYTTPLALRVGRELERYGVFWYEEPLPVDDVEGHARLVDALDVRIAAGENMYTRWHFQDYISRKALDVVQVDCCRVGGVTEARRVAALASAHHLGCAPHTFGDILTLVANLHLVASTANMFILEYDVTYNPLITHLASNAPRVKEGAMELPEGPGLGLELDWDFVSTHPYQGEPSVGLGSLPGIGLT